MEKEKEIKKQEIMEEEELSLDDLDQVSGGSIGKVQYTKTKPISAGTIKKF